MSFNWKSEWKTLSSILIVFTIFYYLPLGYSRFDNAIIEAFYLAKWYAQEHVLLCLVPAFFIAGAIGVFISQASVMKYLGVKTNKFLSYGVASISGSVLAVCSCTVLPLFAGIYRMGAGLGPATAFLYSGPAINVLAIILTSKVLGIELGIARAVGAILFGIVIGLFMHFFFIKEETEKLKSAPAMPASVDTRPLWQNAVYFGLMILILVFANLGHTDSDSGFWYNLYSYKWIITSVLAILFGVVLVVWFRLNKWLLILTGIITTTVAIVWPNYPLLSFSTAILGLSIITALDKKEGGEWFEQTWGYTKQIMPLLLGGVLVAGLLLGRPGNEGLIPSEWISNWVGGNSFGSVLFASIVGAFMYFATLTEIPILQALIGNGMGKGPALALLLAGPALSLPNMLVIGSVMGIKKTVVFVLLVIVMATIAGMLYGMFF